MISGGHVVLYSRDAEADRAFFRDVLGFPHVDAGHGWLIFALPPSEVAVHPAETGGRHEFFLMCDDLDAAMAALANTGVPLGTVETPRWGRLVRLTLPGGGGIGLYEPRHTRPSPV
ncbi:MAG: extradiol dioxygenase [Sphingobium sp.]|jgi:catechol 2,3-dioxygenase-like lactoylglutathione lyase family enzyme|nr:MAG: extradiol dioxygenase [Sphingobium sp.]